MTDKSETVPVEERIATAVADRCHGHRKPGSAPQRYATIWQAARLGAIEAEAASEAQVKALREALEHVRAIISQGALAGFVPEEGDWAARLFESQRTTSEAIKLAGGDPHYQLTQPGAPS